MLSDRSLALWEIVSVVVSCLLAEWVLLAFVGWSKVAVGIPVVLALVLIVSSQVNYDESLAEIGFRTDNFLRLYSASPVANACCFACYRSSGMVRVWWDFRVPNAAFQVSVNSYLGTVSAIRVAGIYKSTFPDLAWKGLEECSGSRVTVCRSSPAKPTFDSSNLRGWYSLGLHLPATTKSVCTSAFSRSFLDRHRALDTIESDKQSSRGL